MKSFFHKHYFFIKKKIKIILDLSKIRTASITPILLLDCSCFTILLLTAGVHVKDLPSDSSGIGRAIERFIMSEQMMASSVDIL